MPFDPTFNNSVRAPIIQAPMFIASTPALALACCESGIIGTFPAHSTRSVDAFRKWTEDMETGLSELTNPAPWGVNLVVHPTNKRMPEDLAICIEKKVPIVLTSKGAPEGVFDQIHEYGGLVFHDVASARHAEIAAAGGADALIAVTGGAGGHCGTINPFALVNEIRQVTDLPVILSGAMSTGRDALAAEAMGCVYAYMGTRFLGTLEAATDDRYRELLIECTSKDVFFSAALDGAPANWIAQSLIECGVDLDELATTVPGEIISSGKVKERYSKVKSCGHGVGMIDAILPARELCERLIAEYDAAKQETLRKLEHV